MKAQKPLKLLRRGKVRDVYDLGSQLLMVASDRLSAFDHVLATPIPGKGKILTQVSVFWFHKTKDVVPNHLVSADAGEIRKAVEAQDHAFDPDWKDRTMLVKKADRVDIECVVRGYLAGSAWKEYKASGTVCGEKLPKGLKESAKLAEPIFTPATKADEGHDENISFSRCVELVGKNTAEQLKSLSIKIFNNASKRFESRGLILADTKFEFGFLGKELIVIDEMLTPDSSRVWEAKSYKPGTSPASFDKQFVRDYLEKIGWNKQPPVPALPPEIAEGLASRYKDFLRIVTS